MEKTAHQFISSTPGLLVTVHKLADINHDYCWRLSGPLPSQRLKQHFLRKGATPPLVPVSRSTANDDPDPDPDPHADPSMMIPQPAS